MTGSDLSSVMRLKDLVGWNQSPEDWRLLMQLAPEGCYVVETGSQVIATGTAVGYERRFGWIGMIIVDPTYRRQGIASRIMCRTIEHFESNSFPCQKLDATEEGAAVYAKLGFRIEYPVERWACESRSDGLRTRESFAGVKALHSSSLERIERLDRDAFGASRAALLGWYLEVTQTAFFVERNGTPAGFILGRPGSRAYQIGPLVAEDKETAAVLIDAALAALPHGPLIADIPSLNRDVANTLWLRGFRPIRHLQRMYRGENKYPGNPAQVHLLSGFELG